MTDESKIVLVKSMTDEKDEEIISAFLAMAGDSVCKYCDPYKRSERETLLEEYGGVQVRIAAYFLNKRGLRGRSAWGKTEFQEDMSPAIFLILSCVNSHLFAG